MIKLFVAPKLMSILISTKVNILSLQELKPHNFLNLNSISPLVPPNGKSKKKLTWSSQLLNKILSAIPPNTLT